MDHLVVDGVILLDGPVGDQQKILHVVEAHDEEEARRHLANDPWARANMLQVKTIQPWALWLDFRDSRARGAAQFDRATDAGTSPERSESSSAAPQGRGTF